MKADSNSQFEKRSIYLNWESNSDFKLGNVDIQRKPNNFDLLMDEMQRNDFILVNFIPEYSVTAKSVLLCWSE